MRRTAASIACLALLSPAAHAADTPFAIHSSNPQQFTELSVDGKREALLQLAVEDPKLRAELDTLPLIESDRLNLKAYLTSESEEDRHREFRKLSAYLRICSRADRVDAVAIATELTAARDAADNERAAARLSFLRGLSSNGRDALLRKAGDLRLSGSTLRADLVAAASTDPNAFRSRLAKMCEGLQRSEDSAPRGIVGQRATSP